MPHNHHEDRILATGGRGGEGREGQISRREGQMRRENQVGNLPMSPLAAALSPLTLYRLGAYLRTKYFQ